MPMFHIMLTTTPLRPKPNAPVGYTPTPFFCEGATLNEAVRKARGEAAQRGLASTYVLAGRIVDINSTSPKA